MGTVRLRNINPLGRVDLPLIAREGDVEGEGIGCLERGEVFEVESDVADVLLEQAGNYELVRSTSKSKSDTTPSEG